MFYLLTYLVTHTADVIIKNRVRYLLQRFLHETDSWTKALSQSRKWQLIGMS